MSEHRKQRLVQLGPDTLADALLGLASRDQAAYDVVGRMLAAPEENVKRFKAKLSGLKRLRRFIGWGESAAFARKLEALLADLEAGIDDPCMGAQLVAAFYETDKKTLGSCDDSSGHVGDVYRYAAPRLFVGYASRCQDKDRLLDLVLKLNRDDDYGVRDALVDCAAEYLGEPGIRVMISRFEDLADKESDEHTKRHWLGLVESLARQIKDAPLFERARIASWDKLSTAACVDIARVYLESGDPRIALSWLERIPADETFKDYERDELLSEVYDRLGETEKQKDVAWRIFRRHRSADSLRTLLGVIGDEEREAVIAGETVAILEKSALSVSDAAFLVEVGRIDEAADYLLGRVGQLDGDFYEGLVPLAKNLEAKGRALAATVIYRALLDSILRRGQTKTYSHGARYLKKLDKLTESISDWGGLDDHSAYAQHLRQKHGRKSSFWSRYE